MDKDEYLGDFSPEELTRYLQATAEWIGDYFAKIEEQEVFPQIEPGDFTRQLPSKPPTKGEDMEEILADFARLIPPATTHWNHPNFHAWFANTGSAPGIVAETLSAALNNNAMVWRSGPASTEMELVVCDWLRQMLGLPDGLFGMIHDTASVAVVATLPPRAIAPREVRSAKRDCAVFRNFGFTRARKRTPRWSGPPSSWDWAVRTW